MAELKIDIAEMPSCKIEARPGSLEAQIQRIMDVAAAEAAEWKHGRNTFWTYLTQGLSVAEATEAAVKAATEDEARRASAMETYEALRTKLSPKERLAGKTDAPKTDAPKTDK